MEEQLLVFNQFVGESDLGFVDEVDLFANGVQFVFLFLSQQIVVDLLVEICLKTLDEVTVLVLLRLFQLVLHQLIVPCATLSRVDRGFETEQVGDLYAQNVQ